VGAPTALQNVLPWQPVFIAASLVAGGCSSSEADLPAGSGVQFTVDWKFGGPPPACLSHPPVRSSSGSASCRILAQEQLYTCPTDIGWLDPLDSDGVRRPRTISVNGTSLQVCEIVQLEGAALEACRNDLTCTGCTPGWCWTEVSELASGACAPGTVYPAFRFVGGSDQPGVTVTIVCDAGTL
jgi:hypothetical protein